LEPIAPEEDFRLSDWLGDEAGYEACLVDLEAASLGTRACREARDHRVKLPIIGLSNRNAYDHWPTARAAWLNGGGDDLVAKPAHPPEVAASLLAAIRRNGADGGSTIVGLNSSDGKRVRMDTAAGTFSVDGLAVYFTSQEARLLSFLMRKHGVVVSKEQIWSSMYPAGRDAADPKIVDVMVCKIRKKLRDHGLPQDFISTIWGRGYLLGDPNASREALGLGPIVTEAIK
jgi:two-component system, cell cycle response regulator CtrA